MQIEVIFLLTPFMLTYIIVKFFTYTLHILWCSLFLLTLTSSLLLSVTNKKTLETVIKMSTL